MTRVLALGGAGAMGVHACRVAAGLAAVAELTIADADATRAARLARELGAKARSRHLDAGDPDALHQAMADADVVVNTVGPFFRFGAPIARAAVESGCSYLDICDDWEPLPELFALDGPARRAGVTALVGMGASPGITNLLAVLAARELDTVEQVFTGWNVEATTAHSEVGAAPSAAIVHGIRQVTGTIHVSDAGREVAERPLRVTHLDYPGLGGRTAWTFGHPEAVTLPRTYVGSSSRNVAFGGRTTMTALRGVAAAVDRRLLTPERAARLVAWFERRRPVRFGRVFRPGALPPLFALAAGSKAGRPASVGSALAQLPGTTMGEVTGVPLGVTLGLLAQAPPGVHAPEAAIDPDAFFAALAPYCLGRPHPDDMVVLTRSWDDDAPYALDRAMVRARATVERAAR